MAGMALGGGDSGAKGGPQHVSPRSQSGRTGTSSPGRPALKHSVCQRRLSNEDVLFVQEGLTALQDGPPWSLYCVCDGHMGGAAARYVEANLWRILAPMLPKSRTPDFDSEDYRPFALAVRTAMVDAFVKVGEQFATEHVRDASGTTVTLALLCGRLLTVANVGDSDAVLDTGSEITMVTVNHRIEDNVSERERLSDAGVQLVPLSAILKGVVVPGEIGTGPLRCWPGGLAVSRSIGDVKAGRHIFSCPHVFQALVPKGGSRLVMATDGMWDLVDWEAAVQSIRKTPCAGAAGRIVAEAALQNDGVLTDDASALVLDILPPSGAEFPKVVKDRLKRSLSGGSGKGRQWAGLKHCISTHLKYRAASALNVAALDDDMELVANMDGWDLLKPSRSDSCSSLSGLNIDPAPVAEEPTPGDKTHQWAPAFLSAQHASLDARTMAERRRAQALRAIPRLGSESTGSPVSGSPVSGSRDCREGRADRPALSGGISERRASGRSRDKSRLHTAPSEGSSSGEWSPGSAMQRTSGNRQKSPLEDGADKACCSGTVFARRRPLEVRTPGWEAFQKGEPPSRGGPLLEQRRVNLAVRPPYDGETLKDRILYGGRRRPQEAAPPEEGEGNGQALFNVRLRQALEIRTSLHAGHQVCPACPSSPASLEPLQIGYGEDSDGMSDDEVSLSAWGPATERERSLHSVDW